MRLTSLLCLMIAESCASRSACVNCDTSIPISLWLAFFIFLMPPVNFFWLYLLASACVRMTISPWCVRTVYWRPNRSSSREMMVVRFISSNWYFLYDSMSVGTTLQICSMVSRWITYPGWIASILMYCSMSSSCIFRSLFWTCAGAVSVLVCCFVSKRSCHVKWSRVLKSLALPNPALPSLATPRPATSRPIG